MPTERSGVSTGDGGEEERSGRRVPHRSRRRSLPKTPTPTDQANQPADVAAREVAEKTSVDTTRAPGTSAGVPVIFETNEPTPADSNSSTDDLAATVKNPVKSAPAVASGITASSSKKSDSSSDVAAISADRAEEPTSEAEKAQQAEKVQQSETTSSGVPEVAAQDAQTMPLHNPVPSAEAGPSDLADTELAPLEPISSKVALIEVAKSDAEPAHVECGEATDTGVGAEEPATVDTSKPPAVWPGDALRHLPDSVLGKLRGFLAGSDKADKTDEPQDDAPNAGSGDASDAKNPLWGAVVASRGAFIAIALFSCIINLLMLVGPLFMLQVYDRVVTSGSLPTLVALFTLTCALFAIMGLLELVRSRVLVRIGREIDGRLSDRVFMAGLRQSLLKKGYSGGPLRELDTVRQFLSGPGPLTFFDAPWTPIYLLVIFMFHWILGVAGLIGAGLLIIIAIASELRSRKPLGEAVQALNSSMDMAETGQRNVEVLQAMGMSAAYRARWQTTNHSAMNWQTQAADRLGSMGALSKSLRLLLQSAMLGLGAALALQNEISAGTIVAATIIFGRSLAPVEMAINQWRSFVRARMAYHKLSELLRALPEPEERTSLPAPSGHLEVEGLRVAVPMSRQMVLNGLSFAVPAGKVLCVVGPSASGKSTLARTLVGLWQPLAGAVRLDGAKLQHWNLDELGSYLGYLPQDVELFAGTVRENIARFHADATDEDIISAARMAHAHDLILALPQGYETELGPFGAHLSAGQRQRVALARALYGKPVLVVLDEPNSNLDRVGDEALARSVAGMRERGQTVVIISHRVQAVRLADLMLYIDGGVQKAFGPREEVLRQLQPQSKTSAPSPVQHRSQAEQQAAAGSKTPGSAAPNADRRPPQSAQTR